MDNATIHSRNLRIQNLLERWKQPLFPHLKNLYRMYWGTLLESSQAEPGAAACMEALKRMGISVGIGTDMTARIQFRKLEVLGLLRHMDFFVSSEETGTEKPHPAFFARCVKKAGCPAKECLFVGDSLKRMFRGLWMQACRRYGTALNIGKKPVRMCRGLRICGSFRRRYWLCSCRKS